MNAICKRKFVSDCLSKQVSQSITRSVNQSVNQPVIYLIRYMTSILGSIFCIHINTYKSFARPIDAEEDSLLPINTARRKEGGRRREVENTADYGSSNRVIGL